MSKSSTSSRNRSAGTSCPKLSLAASRVVAPPRRPSPPGGRVDDQRLDDCGLLHSGGFPARDAAAQHCATVSVANWVQATEEDRHGVGVDNRRATTGVEDERPTGRLHDGDRMRDLLGTPWLDTVPNPTADRSKHGAQHRR
jgi:hypothetical protein